jgi:outer membrane protein TolC
VKHLHHRRQGQLVAELGERSALEAQQVFCQPCREKEFQAAMRVLVVEDEPKTASFLERGFTKTGFVANVAAAALVLLAGLGGCAAYHPLPLNKEAEERALAAPDMQAVVLEAEKIHHPLLKPVHLDPARGFTPEEVAVVAVLTNPGLRAVRDQRGLARAQVIQAGLLPNPVASFGQDKPVGGATQNTVTGYAAQLGFDLTSPLTYSLRKEAARAQAQAVDLDVAWQEWQVAQAARMAALHVLALGEELPLARQAEKDARQTMDAMDRAARTGAVSGAGEAGWRSVWLQAHDRLLLLEQEQARERQGLNQLIGMPPEAAFPLRAGPALPEGQALFEEGSLAEGLGERRLDLLALKKGYESEDKRLRIAIRSQFPNIGIDLSHARDTGNVVTNGYGVAIALPLFDRNQGQIAYEEATRRQLYDEYGARLFAARAEVAQILSDLKAVQARRVASQETLPSLKATAAGFEKALEHGAADLPSLQQAREAYLMQAMAEVRLRAEEADLRLALEIASGRYLPGDAEGQLEGAAK